MKTVSRILQRGFGGITVLVIIVLFSLIGAYMASMSTLASLDTMLSGGSIQSWFAARSGVDWAVYQALNRSCTCGTNCCSTAPAINGTSLAFTEGGLAGFDADISCSESASPVLEGTDSYCVYNIGVTASRGNPGQETYISRRVSVTVSDRDAP